MEIQNIYIIGAGLMGRGIAQNAIQSGFNVVLTDTNLNQLENSRKGIEDRLNKEVAKGRLAAEGMAECLGRLSIAVDYSDLQNSDLIIEAIYENFDAKTNIYRTIEPLCKEGAIIASNTSSISITALSAAIQNKARFIGMHFFSPVPVMKLLEIISGLETAPETVETIKEVGQKLGKTAIVSRDSPGFIVNRLLIPMINEAIVLLDEGVGSAADIDNGMKLGCNHPVGPLELADMIGLDIVLAIIEMLYKQLGDPKYRPAFLLRKMVSAGLLGKKSGRGFYTY